MPAKLLGAHMSTSGGLDKALHRGLAIGCQAVQVFTSSPQQWYAKEITDTMVAEFRKAQKETGLTEVVSHDSYLINLCAPEPEMRQKSFKGLKNELERCHRYGIKYLVSHMGSHKGQGEELGLKGVAEATIELLKETPDDVMLLMETTAGQGSSLNYRFEHLAKILELTGAPPRLNVCLDTCHIFVAGYDIRTEENFNLVFEHFEHLIGFDRLKTVHCNDSMKGLGSKIDRHEHIGEGELGPKPFELLVNDPRFENIPILLETNEADTMHEVNLNRLKGYIHK